MRAGPRRGEIQRVDEIAVGVSRNRARAPPRGIGRDGFVDAAGPSAARCHDCDARSKARRTLDDFPEVFLRFGRGVRAKQHGAAREPAATSHLGVERDGPGVGVAAPGEPPSPPSACPEREPGRGVSRSRGPPRRPYSTATASSASLLQQDVAQQVLGVRMTGFSPGSGAEARLGLRKTSLGDHPAAMFFFEARWFGTRGREEPLQRHGLRQQVACSIFESACQNERIGARI